MAASSEAKPVVERLSVALRCDQSPRAPRTTRGWFFCLGVVALNVVAAARCFGQPTCLNQQRDAAVVHIVQSALGAQAAYLAALQNGEETGVALKDLVLSLGDLGGAAKAVGDGTLEQDVLLGIAPVTFTAISLTLDFPETEEVSTFANALVSGVTACVGGYETRIKPARLFVQIAAQRSVKACLKRLGGKSFTRTSSAGTCVPAAQ